jgi:enoyl-CoA hydratase/carnithine racemase
MVYFFVPGTISLTTSPICIEYNKFVVLKKTNLYIMTNISKVSVDKSVSGYWRVTLNNPPINAIDDSMYDEIYDLVEEIEAEPSLKIVTFSSANPDFYIAHYSTAEPKSRFGKPRWIEAATRLAKSDVISVAVINGRVRGGGAEFALAMDIRFASLEKAIFGQPEVGTGLIPGGGALQRLPLLVGRSKALEIILGGEDYDAASAERWGWINRAVPEAKLHELITTFVRRILSFDKQALSTCKQIINNVGLPDPELLQSNEDLFFTTFGWPGARERFPKLIERGIGKAGDFELNLGDNIGHL